MASTLKESELQGLLDESAVRQVIAEGLRGTDRCDEELAKASYWPDAHYSHIFTSGNAWECSAAIIAMLREKTEAAAHNMGSMSLRVNGDVAACETYIANFIRLKVSGGEVVSVIIMARVLDRLERRDGEWRIVDRKVVPEWQHNAAALIGEEGVREHFSASRKGRDDDSYMLFDSIISRV